ncbi:MAG: response regulator [Lachnospiraceae bacterium]|nr:response regulator [Lachnospiraceae bacterium]MBR2995161.1 response regulator [Lachnospiraceae bacterium]
MTILAVINDKKELKKLSSMIGRLRPEVEVLCCESSPEALALAREKEIDVAFMDTKLAEMDGWVLGQYLKDLYPFINLVYLTEDRADAFEAIVLRASGCILTPATEKSVSTELEELRNTPGQKMKSRVFAQTFGNFELFVDGKPVAFKYTRTKEIVALLINNRGAQTTNGEIIASLWEDDGDPEKKASYLSNLRQDLQNTLTRLKANDIILKQRGSMAIATDHIECDLYEWLEKKKESRYQYLGDYMNQYPWAEFFHAELDEISYAMEDEE